MFYVPAWQLTMLSFNTIYRWFFDLPISQKLQVFLCSLCVYSKTATKSLFLHIFLPMKYLNTIDGPLCYLGVGVCKSVPLALGYWKITLHSLQHTVHFNIRRLKVLGDQIICFFFLTETCISFKLNWKIWNLLSRRISEKLKMWNYLCWPVNLLCFNILQAPGWSCSGDHTSQIHLYAGLQVYF